MPKPCPNLIVQLALKEQLSTVADASGAKQELNILLNSSERNAQPLEAQGATASPMHGPNQLPSETDLPGFQGTMCKRLLADGMPYTVQYPTAGPRCFYTVQSPMIVSTAQQLPEKQCGVMRSKWRG